MLYYKCILILKSIYILKIDINALITLNALNYIKFNRITYLKKTKLKKKFEIMMLSFFLN